MVSTLETYQVRNLVSKFAFSNGSACVPRYAPAARAKLVKQRYLMREKLSGPAGGGAQQAEGGGDAYGLSLAERALDELGGAVRVESS
jgi:hypothetical protein